MRLTDMPDDLMTSAEAAIYLGVYLTTMSSWRWRGVGPAYFRRGQRVYYSQRDLDAYLDSITARVEPRVS